MLKGKKLMYKKTITLILRSLIQLFIAVALLFISPRQQRPILLSDTIDFAVRLCVTVSVFDKWWSSSGIIVA